MKKEAKLLLGKSTRSIILAIDCYNRQWDFARAEAVLIFADHAFEMLMKAYILEKTGRLRETGDNNTYTFAKCLNIGRSSENARFLEDTEVLTLQSLNSFRDHAQHYLLEISKEQLYLQAQLAVTLYRDLLARCFGQHLANELSHVSLPIMPTVPSDPITVFEDDFGQVAKLLKPNRRKTLEAAARLRPIIILERSLAGETSSISERDVRAIVRRIKTGEPFDQVFPAISSIYFTGGSDGIAFSLRIMKNEGIPVQIVSTDTEGVTAVAIKRVNDWDFYNLNHTQLAKKVGLSAPKLTAFIRFLNLEADLECCKFFKSGESSIRKFSQNAIDRVNDALSSNDVKSIWEEHRPRAKAG